MGQLVVVERSAGSVTGRITELFGDDAIAVVHVGPEGLRTLGYLPTAPGTIYCFTETLTPVEPADDDNRPDD